MNTHDRYAELINRDLWEMVMAEEGMAPTDEAWNEFKEFVLILLGAPSDPSATTQPGGRPHPPPEPRIREPLR